MMYIKFRLRIPSLYILGGSKLVSITAVLYKVEPGPRLREGKEPVSGLVWLSRRRGGKESVSGLFR